MRRSLILAAITALTASSALAQTVHFDPAEHMRQQRAAVAYVTVERCVRDRVWHDLTTGKMTDRTAIADDVAVFCAQFAVRGGLVENIQEAVVSVDELAYQLVPDVAKYGP